MPDVLLNWMTLEQGHTVLAVDASGGGWTFFLPHHVFFLFSFSFWAKAQCEILSQRAATSKTN